MKLTTESVLNEETTQEVQKRVRRPVKEPQGQEPEPSDDASDEEEDEEEAVSVPAGNKTAIIIIFVAGMILFLFMGYMILSNLNLSGSKSSATTEQTKTETNVTETVSDETTPKEEQIKKLQDENADLKAQLEAEKQRTANSTNYDATIEDLNKQLKDTKDALAASEAREKALQEQLGATTSDGK